MATSELRSPINLVAADLLSEDLLAAARRRRPASHQQATREPAAVPLSPFRSPARASPKEGPSSRAAHLSAPPSATSHSSSGSRAVGSGRAEGRDELERLVGQRIERQRLRPHRKPGADGELVRPGAGLRAVLKREIHELQARSTAFSIRTSLAEGGDASGLGYSLATPWRRASSPPPASPPAAAAAAAAAASTTSAAASAAYTEKVPWRRRSCVHLAAPRCPRRPPAWPGHRSRRQNSQQRKTGSYTALPVVTSWPPCPRRHSVEPPLTAPSAAMLSAHYA